MEARHWWVADGKASQGPISESELVAKLRSGTLTLSTRVWRPGMTDWDPAGNLEHLTAQLPPSKEALVDTPRSQPVTAPGQHTELPNANPPSQPWSRWFARIWLDYMFSAMLIGFTLPFVAPESAILQNDFAFMWIAAAVWIPIETMFLATAGATPGKYLVGLRIRTRRGTVPSFTAAFSRAISVWIFGCATMLPVVLLFTFGRQYSLLKNRKPTTYDEDGQFIVIKTPLSLMRKILLLLVSLTLLGIMTLGLLSSE